MIKTIDRQHDNCFIQTPEMFLNHIIRLKPSAQTHSGCVKYTFSLLVYEYLHLNSEDSFERLLKIYSTSFTEM